MDRRIGILLGLIGCAVGLACFFLFGSGVKEDPVLSHDQFSGHPVINMDMAYAVMDKRELNAPHAGEPAPAFTLPDLESNKQVSLKSLHREKPVVLLFGSFSCDILDQGIVELSKTREKFKDKANFVMIYIREAHSLNWEIFTKAEKYNDPETSEQRRTVAEKCLHDPNFPGTILIDSVSDNVATRWGAWPVRLFVVDTDGTVLYAAATGPWSFRPSNSFSHGNGQLTDADLTYNQESLEAFLSSHFSDSNTNK